MRFGRIALGEALGAVLAHGIRQNGLSLRKGRVLSAADLAALQAIGLREITAAVIEPGDVPEDEAAARIAAALAGPGLSAQAAFTGRANLAARVSGLVMLDRPTIDALNTIDEAVTVATVPEFEPVTERHLVATVKIIPFAVERSILDRCLDAIGDAHPMWVRGFQPRRAALVQTTLPGLKDSVLEGTAGVTAARLRALGSILMRQDRCAHDAGALATCLRDALADGSEVILIAGASAVVDRQDVIPAAICQAGGTIDRLGMPVDPGNLLLLGQIGPVAVIGMPGCARSPKTNGFDWVLQRLCAGLPIDSAAIARMGVGGLLTEIAARPHPRDPGAPTRPQAPNVAALVLAAGRSSRMGRNKLLLDWHGAPMVARVVDHIAASAVSSITVVTGHDSARVREALIGRDVEIVENPDYADGLSTSLAAGLAAIPPDADAVLIALGDMPLVRAHAIDQLIAAFSPEDGRAICVPRVGERRGNPVLWAIRFVPEMIRVTGDQGARHVLAAHPDKICEIALGDDGTLIDIDTPDLYAALTKTSGL